MRADSAVEAAGVVTVVLCMLATIALLIVCSGDGTVWCWEGKRVCQKEWKPCHARVAERARTVDGVTTYEWSFERCECVPSPASTDVAEGGGR